MAVETDSTRNWNEWGSTELANYLKGKGLADYAEIFVNNNITGEVAPNLTDENLKEMGIDSVGDRIRIRNALEGLRKSHAQTKEEEVLWTGTEVLYFSWFHAACTTCCGCCPKDPSIYSLRANHLEIKTVSPCRLGPIRCCTMCCAEKYHIDNIDLSKVSDADVKGVPPGCLQQTCCCAETQEHVTLLTNNEGDKVLKLHKDEGQQVARRIKTQVEAMQRMERS